MTKRILIMSLSIILAMASAIPAFAEETSRDKIISVEDLKENIKELKDSNENTGEKMEALFKRTSKNIVDSFAKEKMRTAMETLESLGEVSMSCDEKNNTRTIDIGDGCWIKIESTSKKILSDENQSTNISLLALSDQSEYKEAEWKKYGKYCFTAKATIFYGVASAQIILKNYYTLNEKGITITQGVPGNSSSGLMHVDNGSCDITDKYARTPGGSDVNMMCTYQVSYGYAPIEWSNTAAMHSTVRYLGIDKTKGEIHLSERWTFKKVK